MALKRTLMKLGLVEEETVPIAKKAIPTTPQTATPVRAPVAAIDEAIAKALEQSLQENKLSGFDYLKFIAATDEMKVYNTPEETRFKMAFSTAKQMGLDVEGLTKSAKHYVSVLKQDEEDFDAECAQFQKKEIVAKEAKLTELEAKIVSLDEQAKRAREDYSALNEELKEKKSSLESRKAAFQTTLQSFVDNIEDNIAKITKYLS